MKIIMIRISRKVPCRGFIPCLILAVALAVSSAFGQSSFDYNTTFTGGTFKTAGDPDVGVGNGYLPIVAAPNYQGYWYSSPDLLPGQYYPPYAGVVPLSGGGGNALFLGGANVTGTDGSPLNPSNNVWANLSLNNAFGSSYSSNGIYFNSTFQVNPGTSTNLDTFGWTLFNSLGNQLMSINLNPISGGSQYTLGATSFAADSDLSNQTLLKIDNSPIEPIVATNWYHLGFEVNGIGTASQSVSVYTYSANGHQGTPYLIGTTMIPGTDFSDPAFDGIGVATPYGGTNIAILSATWTISPTGYGDNTMYMQQFGVASMVPEPKTWALLGISGLIMVVALRRRKA